MRGALGAAGFALMLAYQGLAENRDMAPSLREQAAAALADGDEIRARRLIEQAADAGDPEAINGLGFYVYTGVGGPRDEARGLALYEKRRSRRARRPRR